MVRNEYDTHTHDDACGNDAADIEERGYDNRKVGPRSRVEPDGM